MVVLRYHVPKLHCSRESSTRLESASEETRQFNVHDALGPCSQAGLGNHEPHKTWRQCEERSTHATYDGDQFFEIPRDYMKEVKLMEKGTSRADVLTVVEESEIAGLQSCNSDSGHKTDLEDDEMGDIVNGNGRDGDGDCGWEKPKQEKKKPKANAEKRGRKAGSIEDTVRESERKQLKRIKYIRNPKSQEHKMDGSGTASDPLKL